MPTSTPPLGRARLVAREPVGGGMLKLTLRATPELHATYTVPGQYTELTIGVESGFFAIASGVGDPAWELVMRGGGGAADTLLTMPLGDPVNLSPALGDGFPCAEARGRPVLMAANGTGIAAARPVFAQRIADGDGPRTALYLGVRTPTETPLLDELDRWRQRGASVTICVSQATSVAGDYASGYVQDAVRTRAHADDLRGGMIFAVGAESMVLALRELAPRLGIAPSDVRTNY